MDSCWQVRDGEEIGEGKGENEASCVPRGNQTDQGAVPVHQGGTQAAERGKEATPGGEQAAPIGERAQVRDCPDHQESGQAEADAEEAAAAD